jgi:nucleoside phosphorylase
VRLAVVAALREELAPAARRLLGKGPPPPGEWRRGTLGRHVEVLLMTTGDGSAAAGRAVRALLAATAPRLLVGIGCAGGLTPDLRCGDLVLGEQVIEVASGRVLRPPASPWLERARNGDDLRAGTLVTSRTIARTPAEKERLARLAGSGPAVVDLESAVWAAAATAAGVPFVVVRGVVDRHDEALPLDFENLRGERGSVARGRVVWAACRRPAAWTGLLRLRREVRRVAESLGAWTAEVLAP